MQTPAQVSASLPTGLRARLWLPAPYLFSRASAQDRCWLWLLHEDGALRALHLDAACYGQDSVLPLLLAHWSELDGAVLRDIAGVGQVQPLPAAPVVPLPRWSLSWGHPLQRQMRAFAQLLDVSVLDFLGEMEAASSFLGSVGNYNRLACLPDLARARRMQAMRDFPPLLVPVLLDTEGRPQLLADGYANGYASGYAGDDAWSVPPWHCAAATGALCAVIDQGQSLVKALAAHYRISRSLVRSPLCRSAWRWPQLLHRALPLLDALAAHARPRTLAEWEQWLPCLRALPLLDDGDAAPALLARCFAGGWAATWQAVADAAGLGPEQLAAALGDCRDFLRAALAQEPLPEALERLEPQELGSAWLIRRGIGSLLQASRRWHQQALQPGANPLPVAAEPLPALLGNWQHQGRHAQELLRAQALVDEGNAMRHCVGGYWHECASECQRVVHLALPGGEKATACFVCARIDGTDPQFELDELRGPDNDEASAPMHAWAHEVLAQINAPERQEQRRQAWLAAQAYAASSLAYRAPPRHVRPLDRRSRQELAQVLAWCIERDRRMAAAEGGHIVLRETIAGTGYGQAPQLLAQLRPGDALDLVREPHNPYDAHAIRLDWRGHKLGYVPRRKNRRLAQSLDEGRAFEAVLQAVERGNPEYPHLAFYVRTLGTGV